MSKQNLYLQAADLATAYLDWKAGVGKDKKTLTWEEYCQIENELDLEVVNLFWSALNAEYEGLDADTINAMEISHLASMLKSEAYSD